MSEETEQSAPPPIVFLSYSHDSRDHKRWVGKLAEMLRSKHVEVILDQWDLEPGDDVPKFMERAVKSADRVVMICSEPYVRKANDGKGGVGYEAMIVTGELVRDLGTRKFIPVIRQAGGDTVVPDCVSTRLYIDFSNDEDFDESLEQLVKTIHQVVAASKPPLGPHPYTDLASPSSVTLVRQAEADAPFSGVAGNPSIAYRSAASLASTRDVVGWRRMMKALERQAVADLIAWRINNPAIPSATDRDFTALHEHAALGVHCYAPFFAALVAGAESGQPEFCGQLGWIDEISKPPAWNPEGAAYWYDFPELLLFIGHALVGSMLMEAQASKQVYDLATTRLPHRWRDREQKALFKDTSVTGWPHAMLHTCTIAWSFLIKQADEAWVVEAFGSPEHFKSALCAYYQYLSFLNFVSLSAQGNIESGKMEWAVTVPLSYCNMERDTAVRGYRTFLSHRSFLLSILKENGLESPDQFRKHWKIWLAECSRWLGGVFKCYFDFSIPQASLPDDIIVKNLRISDL
jgi:hypothetical protein